LQVARKGPDYSGWTPQTLVAGNLGIQLFCLLEHCSHEQQTLDKSLLKHIGMKKQTITKINIQEGCYESFSSQNY
jgi:hypothetical protein